MTHPSAPAPPDPRFAFGENWASYAAIIDDEHVAEAERGLIRLLGDGGLEGKSFLDIGCGSGLHALSALRLGAARVVAFDFDPRSVETTRAVLARHAPGSEAEVCQFSVLDLTPETFGRFDIVYSWGVLHHTGAMREAVTKAAAAVAPGGLFCFALYRRTRLCGFWTREKRWYAQASPRAQGLARAVYVSAFRAGLRVTGRNLKSHVANYKSGRGMDFAHDVHDWLGGYPYESILAPDVERLMRELGFAHARSFTRPLTLGLLGSGCDEYVYRRESDPSS